MLWALVPVALIAFHFGPGEGLAARERAAARFRDAMELEQEAIAAQEQAYAIHLRAIEARRLAFLENSDEDLNANEALSKVLAEERDSYAHAGDLWSQAADAYEQVEEQLVEEDEEVLQGIRWSKARARVRSGAIWDGAIELESLLDDIDRKNPSAQQQELARAAREELGVAYYFGARLLREAGEPANEWRAQAVQARQHFRYLAETASASGLPESVIRGLEDNVERTIDLEQMDKSELEGRPLPRQSPRGMRGRRPGQGQPGTSQRPPTRPDGRGAGGAGPIGPGW